jgi:hypothetical protein
MMFEDVIAAFYDTDTKCVNRDGNWQHSGLLDVKVSYIITALQTRVN